jgi:hypothetical protein
MFIQFKQQATRPRGPRYPKGGTRGGPGIENSSTESRFSALWKGVQNPYSSVPSRPVPPTFQPVNPTQIRRLKLTGARPKGGRPSIGPTLRRVFAGVCSRTRTTHSRVDVVSNAPLNDHHEEPAKCLGSHCAMQRRSGIEPVDAPQRCRVTPRA